jgi:hypothetical protein
MKKKSIEQKRSRSLLPRNRSAPGITPSQKCSITLYQTDLDILDDIRDYLRRKGVRNLSDSEALRLACRTVSLDDRLVKTYETMRVEDGRRRR